MHQLHLHDGSDYGLGPVAPGGYVSSPYGYDGGRPPRRSAYQPARQPTGHIRVGIMVWVARNTAYPHAADGHRSPAPLV